MKAWKDFCQPKSAGGLGFRQFKDINTALLAKLGWKLARESDSLWCRALRAKYMKVKCLFEIGIAKGSSPGWNGILSSRHALINRACFKIGNGCKINLWKDPWISELPGKVHIAKIRVDTSIWNKVKDF